MIDRKRIKELRNQKNKGKIFDDIKNIEISDSLGKKISKVSKQMPWYRKINPMANQNYFKKKLYKKLTEDEKIEFISKEKDIMKMSM